MKLVANNAINSDSEKRRAFVAPLFTAGYGERSIQENNNGKLCALLPND